MEREQSYFKAFQETSRILTSTLDIGEVIRHVASLTAEAAQVKGCSILLLDRRKHRLELIANHGLSERYLTKGPLDADLSLAESLKGEVVCISDIASDPRVQYPAEAQAEGIASMLSVPMFLKGGVIGVLRLYSERSRVFPEHEVEFASALAELGAIALENARLYSSLRDRYENLIMDFNTWFEAGVDTLRETFRNHDSPDVKQGIGGG